MTCLAKGDFVGALQLSIFLVLFNFSGAVFAYGDPPEAAALGARFSSACESHLTGAALEAAKAKWQGKTVILDTNVLLNDPYAVFKYPGAKLIIPGTVFEELDNKKKDLETGKAAREFSRIVDDLLKSGQNLYKGVGIGNGTVLVVDNRDLTFVLDDTTLDRRKKDNEIVALAVWYTSDQPYGSVVLVSDDRNVRIKASSEEVLAIPFEYDWVVSPKGIKKEYQDLIVSDQELKHFLATGVLPRAPGSGLRPNEFVMVRTATVEGCPECLARYVFDRERPEVSRLRRVPDYGDLPAPPRNFEQRMLFDLLFDPSVHLVIVEAQAGTGKTFVTMEAALLQRPGAPGKFSGRYDEVTITKPMASMGREGLGTLPGGASEKMSEKFKSFYDNLKVLVKMMNGGKPSQQRAGKGRHFVRVPNLEIAPLPEVRGRSFHDTLLVIDEFQNTNLHEAKTILTRAASGTKIVVLGNAAQIDVPYLNELNNGLSIAATIFTDPNLSDAERSLVGFVRLKEGERSELTDLANKVYSQPLPVR